MDLPYHVLDVFTTKPLEGNPLAVFPDASGLDTIAMQRIARELNLSETAFVFPRESRDGATRVRIFTPASEMNFAGHPTIGTAFLLRRLGMVAQEATSFALAENVGLVNVRVDAGVDPLLWLMTPPIAELEAFPREICARALSLGEADLLPDIPCGVFSAGNLILFVAVRDCVRVDRASLDRTLFLSLVAGRGVPVCAFVFAPTENGAYSRMFAPQLGIIEDPATGSATGPLAAYMMKHALVSGKSGTSFTSEQGTKMGRRSMLHVLIHGTNGCEGIEIGGNTAHVATGTLHLPT